MHAKLFYDSDNNMRANKMQDIIWCSKVSKVSCRVTDPNYSITDGSSNILEPSDEWHSNTLDRHTCLLYIRASLVEKSQPCGNVIENIPTLEYPFNVTRETVSHVKCR